MHLPSSLQRGISISVFFSILLSLFIMVHILIPESFASLISRFIIFLCFHYLSRIICLTNPSCCIYSLKFSSLSNILQFLFLLFIFFFLISCLNPSVIYIGSLVLIPPLSPHTFLLKVFCNVSSAQFLIRESYLSTFNIILCCPLHCSLNPSLKFFYKLISLTL